MAAKGGRGRRSRNWPAPGLRQGLDTDLDLDTEPMGAGLWMQPDYHPALPTLHPPQHWYQEACFGGPT
jgi:hypothetical protein